jgi:iron(III) transport system substrate-binding protein
VLAQSETEGENGSARETLAQSGDRLKGRTQKRTRPYPNGTETHNKKLEEERLMRDQSGFGRISRRSVLKGAGIGAAAIGGLWPETLLAQEKVAFYSGSAVEPTNDLCKLFTEKTGTPMEYFRAGSNNLAQKYEQEVKANQVRASVIALTNPTLARKWAKDGLLMEYASPEFKNYPDQFVLANYFGPMHGEPHVMAYNTEIVKADQAPKTWTDLLDPKWKNKLALTDAASSNSALHWYAAMRATYGKEFLQKLADQNVLIKTGGAEVGATLVSGERQVAAMITQGHTQRAIGAGGKLRIVIPPEGAPMLYTVIFIPAKAPNPEVGKKFLDFALSQEAQLMLDGKHFNTSLRKGMPWKDTGTGAMALSEVKPIASSPADLEKELAMTEELVTEYNDLFK